MPLTVTGVTARFVTVVEEEAPTAAEKTRDAAEIAPRVFMVLIGDERSEVGVRRAACGEIKW